MPKVKKAEVQLEYQGYIFQPPVAPKAMRAQAAGGDEITVEVMSPLWIENVKQNHKKYGPFSDKGVGKIFGVARNQPVICVGSGPSLKKNGEELKDTKGVKTLSCLHNFHYFEDRDIKIDYYVTLDAQEITVGEVSEGGSHDPEWYWERTEGKTLLAYIGTHPKLLEKWRGEVLFFNCPVPDARVEPVIDEIEKFWQYVISGGNVLGACVYIAKAIMGANPIVFVGADFCFSYDKKFHGWDSKYDQNLGNVVQSVDVFGNRVSTWMSYHGFKGYFEWLSLTVPGLWINCTEGGTLGSYASGNLISIMQMDLCDFYEMYSMSEKVREAFCNPDVKEKLILYN